jgi:hypothetical protein
LTEHKNENESHEKAEHKEHHSPEHGNEAQKKSGSEASSLKPFLTLMVVILVAFVAVNQYLIGTMTSVSAIAAGSQGAPAAGAASDLAAIEAQILPRGVPAVYGAELGISYDDVDINNAQKANALIAKLVALDDPNPKSSLTADQLKRFLDIGNQIGCEYCCSLGVMVTADGGRPCGCQHSWAMRGIAQYLIKKHPEMTNAQILEEIGKWKTLFFPDNIGQKALMLKQQGIELSYTNLASIKYKDIEKGTASGARQVGGC